MLQLMTPSKNPNGLVPPEISSLYGDQYNLQVSVTRKALQRVRISYQVDSISPILSVVGSTSATDQIHPDPSIVLPADNIAEDASTTVQTVTMAETIHRVAGEIHVHPLTTPSIGSTHCATLSSSHSHTTPLKAADGVPAISTEKTPPSPQIVPPDVLYCRRN